MSGVVAVASVLFLTAIAGVGQANAQVVRSYGRLGHGRFTSLQWEAWGEVTTKSGGVEETCITVGTLEPTEGNESTNCAPSKVPGLEEIVRSPYGVVAAAMYSPTAKRVAICIKGGREVFTRLRPIRLRVEAGRPTRSYSYFARGFRAGTRISWMTPLDAGGAVVTERSDRRRCV